MATIMTYEVFEGWTYTLEGLLIKPDGTICSRNPAIHSGYLTVRVGGRLYRQHRVIYFLHTGEQPEEIDHIDRNRANNAVSNLRSVNHSENNQNKGVRRDSSTGIKGVSYTPNDHKTKPWRADFKQKPIRKTKRFATKEEAIAQRKVWEDTCSISY